MTWTTYHNRGEILRTVMAVADQRRDGLLPMDIAGVESTFIDELDLIATLQLKWHTRLSGQVERQLMDQPMELEDAVVTAWRLTAQEMPGVRAIIDHHRAAPTSEEMARVLSVSQAKEQQLLAIMAGRSGCDDERAVPVGARIERRARAGELAGRTDRVESAGGAGDQAGPGGTHRFLDRLKAALAA